MQKYSIPSSPQTILQFYDLNQFGIKESFAAGLLPYILLSHITLLLVQRMAHQTFDGYRSYPELALQVIARNDLNQPHLQ